MNKRTEEEIIKEYEEKDEPATKGFVRGQIRELREETARAQRTMRMEFAEAERRAVLFCPTTTKPEVIGAPSLRGLVLMLGLNFVLWILFLWWIQQTLSLYGLS